MDYLTIGCGPCEEPCVQVGDPDYYSKARKECQRYIHLIRKKLGHEPFGARLQIKFFPHDFGEYAEVICTYNDGEGLSYALKCESEAPSKWEE